MAVVTTYVCDVSGKTSSNSEDFLNVTISTKDVRTTRTLSGVTKLVHKDVADKINLIQKQLKKDEVPTPSPTFESKLAILLRDFTEEVAYEASEQALNNYRNG